MLKPRHPSFVLAAEAGNLPISNLSALLILRVTHIIPTFCRPVHLRAGLSFISSAGLPPLSDTISSLWFWKKDQMFSSCLNLFQRFSHTHSDPRQLSFSCLSPVRRSGFKAGRQDVETSGETNSGCSVPPGLLSRQLGQTESKQNLVRVSSVDRLNVTCFLVWAIRENASCVFCFWSVPLNRIWLGRFIHHLHGTY